MNITLNGQNKAVSDGTTLDALVISSAKKPELVIAEVNGAIIARSNWQQTILASKAQVELVTFVGGG